MRYHGLDIFAAVFSWRPGGQYRRDVEQGGLGTSWYGFACDLPHQVHLAGQRA
jgi:hypothetical protein